MKKFLFLVTLVLALAGFTSSTLRAAEPVQPIPACPEGYVCTNISGTFQFVYPETNQTWYAGQVCSIGFISSNINGYVNFQLADEANPEYNRYGISNLSLYENGVRSDYFILPRYVDQGRYRIVAFVRDYNTGQSLSVTSSVVITVPNSIISPAHGDLVQVGKKIRVKLASRVPIGDIAVVHVRGKGLGQQYDHLALGTIRGGWDRLITTIPATLPNQEHLLNGGDYQIVVSSWSTWLYGETFSVFNPKLNLPIPLTGGSGNNSGGSGSSGGGGVGIAGKN